MLTRPRVIGAKEEASYGVAETIAGADMFLAGSIKWTPDAGRYQSANHQPSLSPEVPGRGRTKASISFDVEMMGSGTPGTAPFWGKLLKACGWSETIVGGISVTYAPATTGIVSLTIKGFFDGVAGQFKGSRGTVSVNHVAGELSIMSFSFDGLWDPFSDANAWKDEANLAGTAYPTFPAKPFISALLKLDSFYPVFENYSWVLNNVLTMVPDGNTAGVYIRNDIVGRGATGEIDAESELIATYDFVGKMVAATPIAFQAYTGAEETGQNGTGSLNAMTDSTKAWIASKWVGNQVRDSAGTTFAITANDATTLTVSGTPVSGEYEIYESGKLIKESMPKIVIGNLSDTDKGGIYNHGVPFSIYKNVAAGNDEMSILCV